MTEASSIRSRRVWADLVAIFTALAIIALAIWPGGHTVSASAARESGNSELLWIMRSLAGGTALLAVFVGQQWKHLALARALLVVSALILLAMLLVFRDFGTRALMTLLLPATLFIVSATGLGPIPPPRKS